jgi:hypothetical protein
MTYSRARAVRVITLQSYSVESEEVLTWQLLLIIETSDDRIVLRPWLDIGHRI